LGTIIVFFQIQPQIFTIQNSSNTKIDKIIVSDIYGKKVLEQNQNALKVNANKTCLKECIYFRKWYLSQENGKVVREG
jgi:hypothetical protein